ncbi:hypothetical protein C464_06220 [Halorubrum coriense DSM 10284]|uniref:Uncharacterized protein n=1 Tax=Halorubrum coriense DSM 10284 TaxID=1227466 RepID=M0ERD8_9EURY|nr:hypothetical protein [Halorubrum coriense]ELZ48984.1 hypothetical protein C464_06220 [Halorubrum coriense DSM 10284]QRG24121.1 hypothetical protein HrrHm1_050 [Halorubrum virus Humcor1]
MTERPSIYRVTRTCRYGGGELRDAGELWIDPPAGAVDGLGRHLERLDEDGRLPRDELGTMRYSTLQQLAAAGDVNGVDGNSEMEAIIDAYAIDGADDTTES